MSYLPVNLSAKLALFAEHWSPRVIAEINYYQIKLVKIQGEFTWHRHADTDELLICLDGEMAIDFRDGWVVLSSGEMFVVPKGKEHKPSAETECHVMLFEPRGVVNTGDAVNSGLTATGDAWI